METWQPHGHIRGLKKCNRPLNQLLNRWGSIEGIYTPEMDQKFQNVSFCNFCTWWNIYFPTNEKHIPLKQTLLNLCVLYFPYLHFSAYCNMHPKIFSHRGKHKHNLALKGEDWFEFPLFLKLAELGIDPLKFTRMLCGHNKEGRVGVIIN